MQLGNFIDVFLARHVLGAYALHEEHLMLGCSVWVSAPSFWIGTASHGTIRTVHTTYAAALKTTANPKTRCRNPYAATQHQMLLMMGVCTRNMSSLVASSWHFTFPPAVIYLRYYTLPEIFNVLFQISFHASLFLGLFYMFIAFFS